MEYLFGLAYRFQFFLPKSCLLAGEGGDEALQPGTRQWRGEVSALGIRHIPEHSLRTGST